jgi:Predicted membrane protein (DUF2142)
MRRIRAVVGWCRASPRRQWWSAFAVMMALGVCWSLATPLFASPDEPDHVIRAASIVRGQILGSEPHGKKNDGSLEVQVPAKYGSGSRVACFAFNANATANCASFTGASNRDVTLSTTAGRHPPWWYVFVGWPSLLFVSGFGVRLMRVANTALTAAFMASAFVSVLRMRHARIGAIGLAIATTPMLLFLAGVVNPSAVEIAAAISLWTAGFALITEAPIAIDRRLVVRVGVAACALALTRQLGPVWLGIIGVTLLAIGGRPAVDAIRASRPVKVAVSAAVLCCLAQGIWIVSTGTLDTSYSNTPGVPGGTIDLLSKSMGRGLIYFDELIGVFGWRDTVPPTAVYLFWTAVVGGIVALALLTANRRVLLAMLTTAFFTWFLPIVLEARSAHAAGFFWQGRYTLPLAVGVPILAALAVAHRASPPPVGTRRILWCVGVPLGVAQLLAFVQAIRRYAVGARGALDFFTKTAWAPPVPAVLLVVAFAVAVVAWYFLLFLPAPGEDTEGDEADVTAVDTSARTPLAVGSNPAPTN